MIYPVYHREGYGWQVDNPEGTDGLPLLYALYEECSDGGEGYEIVSFPTTMLGYIQKIADFLNTKDSYEGDDFE